LAWGWDTLYHDLGSLRDLFIRHGKDTLYIVLLALSAGYFRLGGGFLFRAIDGPIYQEVPLFMGIRKVYTHTHTM